MAIARWSIRPRGQRSRPSRRTTRWGFSLAIGCGTTTGRRRPCHRYRPRGHRARRQRGHRRPPVARCGPRTGWRSPPRRSSGFGRSCWHGRHRTLERLLPQRRHPRRLLSSRATAATAGSRRSSRPTPHGTRQRAQPVRELGPPPERSQPAKTLRMSGGWEARILHLWWGELGAPRWEHSQARCWGRVRLRDRGPRATAVQMRQVRPAQERARLPSAR